MKKLYISLALATTLTSACGTSQDDVTCKGDFQKEYTLSEGSKI
jgi:hypothetical protein